MKRDALFDLITSLTKAEKRNFRIYAKKIQSSGDVLFLKLFDYLERQVSYDINDLLSSVSGIQKNQIANLKRNLYRHILTSLRLLYSQKQVSLQIRAFIDDAEILYNKGLYFQALKILGRAKKIALKNHRRFLNLEIVAFESKIESRHITRSSTERMSDLMQESKLGNQILRNTAKFSNLKLYLQRVFINDGHLIDEEAKEATRQYFNTVTRHFQSDIATFTEKVFYFQACYWYHFLLQDYYVCHQYAQKWVALYEVEKNMITADVNMYLRAMHHLLNTAFFLQDGKQLTQQVKYFEQLILNRSDQFSLNSFVQAHLFLYQAQFNNYFLNNQFKEGLSLVPKVLDFIKQYEYQLDNYKIMILYYKVASCYLGAGVPAKTIDYVNLIVNNSKNALREDILRFSRLLGVLAYYELKNTPALEYFLSAVERQLHNLPHPDQLSLLTIQFFKKLCSSLPKEKPSFFKAFHNDINILSKRKEEGRAFIFLDILKWVSHRVNL